MRRERGMRFLPCRGGCSTLESTPLEKVTSWGESRRGTTIEMDRRLVVLRHANQKCDIFSDPLLFAMVCALHSSFSHIDYIQINNDVCYSHR